MTMDEATRRSVSNRLREVLGTSEADALMTVLPTHPIPDLATREDVALMIGTLRAELQAEAQTIRAEIEHRFAAIDRQFASVDRQFASVDRQFGELKGELGALEGTLKAEIARQTVTLALTLGSLTIAVLGAILTLGFTGAFA